MIPRIHFPLNDPAGTAGRLADDEHHYLLRVMRARQGDEIELFDGRGHRSRRRIVEIHRDHTVIDPGQWSPGPRPAVPRIRLAQALSSSEKMDWTLEKAVELGVASVQPVISRQSIVKLPADRLASRMAHWHRLAVAACRQSGRDDLPDIQAPLDIGQWLQQAEARPGPRLMLALPAAGTPTHTLSDWARGRRSPSAGFTDEPIELLVGPESGLHAEEIAAARAAGYVAVTLGGLVLRTETAGLAAVSALRALAGDF